MAQITAIVGNIVEQPDCDAVVNSANERLRAGSGVCGAIHGAAGHELDAFSSRLAPLMLSQAVVTPGFSLSNPWIIHVRGPKYLFDPNPALALQESMHGVIRLADRHKFERIAVPAISTGVYGYPMDEAIPILVASCKDALQESESVQEVRFVVTSRQVADLFQAQIDGYVNLQAKVLCRRLIEAIRDQFKLNWNGIHGVTHWSRVRLNGLDLARETGADPVVVELFAFFHDACRQNDGTDPSHGSRAAEFVTALQGKEIWLKEDQLSLLRDACSGHTYGKSHPDITVATCWDADRLDLWRLEIEPDPSRLLTEAAKSPQRIEQSLLRLKK